MKLKESKAVNWLYNKRSYFMAFFIPSLLMLAVYLAFGFPPFGDKSVLVLDLNGQYIYYYEAMRDAFWGDGSMFYSWSRNLSGEMLGIYAYYLASPFNIIIMLLPREMILESVLIMQLAKIGTCGIIFNYYLRNSKKITSYTSIIFSTLYALMAYVIIQLMNPMWLDGVIYLPLILYGVEKLIDEGKLTRFIIPLTLLFFANFYIGYMVGIFSFLYFIIYMFFCQKDEDTAAKKKIMIFVKFAVGALIAVLAAAIILLPTYYSLKLGKLEFSTPNFELKPDFKIAAFFTKLLPESYDTVRPEGLPVVYCGVLTLIMVPLYFLNKNIENRKKVGSGLLLALVFVSMYLSTVDLAWHGFQVPNWLPYRYSFTFCFVMLVMAAEAFERIEGVSFKQIAATGLIIIAYIISVDSKGLSYIETTNSIWFSLMCVIGFIILLNYYKNHATVKTAPLVLLILVVGELFGGTLHTLKAINKDVVYSKHSSYGDYIQQGRDLVDKVEELDGSEFFRMEKTYHRTVNDAMAFGNKGISHSSSTLNAGVIDFLEKMGFSCGGHYIKYNGATLVTDSVLGIKYIATKDIKVPYDKNVLTQNDVTVYENENALPLGFMVDAGIRDTDISSQNPFQNQNYLLNGMMSGPYTDYFVQIPVEKQNLINLTSSVSGNNTKYAVITKGQDASVEFTLNAPTDDIIYCYFDSAYKFDLSLWVNNAFLQNDTEKASIKTLGKFNAGDTVSYMATLKKDDMYLRNKWFYYLDEDKFSEAVNTLKQNPLNITKFDETHIEGTVHAEDNQIMMTTITYEPGWTIKVDGDAVEPLKLAGGLIGIPMEAGDHTVTMSFFPHGLALGIIMSAVGIAAIVFIVIYENKKKKVLLKRLYE